MPGGPNRPPDVEVPPETAAVASAPSAAEPQRRALRRLVPMRVALRLEIWKGAPSPELLTPLGRAEEAYRAGDFAGADGALDALAIRLAEPRWPTLPEPFRSLRVRIPTPQPPHWDPEHAVPTAEKQAREARRAAERQLALAGGSLDAEARRGTAVDDLRPVRDEAERTLGPDGAPATDEFYAALDRFWSALRERVPLPGSASGAVVPRATPPSPAVGAESGAEEA